MSKSFHSFWFGEGGSDGESPLNGCNLKSQASYGDSAEFVNLCFRIGEMQVEIPRPIYPDSEIHRAVAISDLDLFKASWFGFMCWAH